MARAEPQPKRPPNGPAECLTARAQAQETARVMALGWTPHVAVQVRWQRRPATPLALSLVLRSAPLPIHTRGSPRAGAEPLLLSPIRRELPAGARLRRVARS